ncbi:protein kinase domain-containing protein [Butyrivibrio sp. MC2013]|uniref:protein kinase domain-containing protein n=1 Tax=Butyrivibrio sp. MC2013 TaxID=1280686 RepID=UPI00041ADA3A|nr:AarF/UbiB family protein [Butyrivibrio sp. MC2013]
MKENWEEFVTSKKNDPLTQESLEDALAVLTLSEAPTLTAAGGQGLLYKVEIGHAQYFIKIPYYSRHKSIEVARHNILKEAIVLERLNENGDYEYVPKLLCYSRRGNYLIREYIPGAILNDCIKHASYDERKKLLEQEYVMAQSLFKTFHDHKEGSMVIRDFKPANIISGDDGGLVIIDFGSVKREDELNSHKPQNMNRFLGTGKYLHWPLEQMVDNGIDADRRVDYFAFGVMAFYTLFIESPFDNKEQDYDKAAAKYRTQYHMAGERLDSLCKSDPEIDKWKDIIMSALETDIDKRKFL